MSNTEVDMLPPLSMLSLQINPPKVAYGASLLLLNKNPLRGIKPLQKMVLSSAEKGIVLFRLIIPCPIQVHEPSIEDLRGLKWEGPTSTSTNKHGKCMLSWWHILLGLRPHQNLVYLSLDTNPLPVKQQQVTKEWLKLDCRHQVGWHDDARLKAGPESQWADRNMTEILWLGLSNLHDECLHQSIPMES